MNWPHGMCFAKSQCVIPHFCFDESCLDVKSQVSTIVDCIAKDSQPYGYAGTNTNATNPIRLGRTRAKWEDAKLSLSLAKDSHFYLVRHGS